MAHLHWVCTHRLRLKKFKNYLCVSAFNGGPTFNNQGNINQETDADRGQTAAWIAAACVSVFTVYILWTFARREEEKKFA